MLDLRVYRAAFVPALLAHLGCGVLAPGSPAPTRRRYAPDAFDARRRSRAAHAATELAQRAGPIPGPRPGSDGDARLADRVARSCAARAGLAAARVRGGDDDGGDGATSRRSSARAPGLGPPDRRRRAPRRRGPRRRRRAVGHRRAAGAGARLRADARRRRTLAFVSTSGGGGGSRGRAGARRARRRGRRPIDAVLVLGDVAANESPARLVRGRPTLGAAPLALHRTVEAPCARRSATTRARRALAQGRGWRCPLTVTEQGRP